MTRPRVDHVTWAGTDLDAVRSRMDGVGLPSAYGGPHSNGVTHMAVVAFPDGSYLELLAPREPDCRSPVWERAVRAEAGPAAWAVGCDDIASEAGRFRAAGLPVRGPEPWSRETPGGARAVWDLAFPGEGEPGSTLPFLIEDRTPRTLRVRPDPQVGRTGLSGVERVVLLVGDLARTAADFRAAYGWPAPREAVARTLGARLACFDGTPVTLASPLGAGEAPDSSADAAERLAARLEALGPAPCAFLLGVSDPSAAAAALRTGPEEAWIDERVRWIPVEGADDRRLGVLWPARGRTDADEESSDREAKVSDRGRTEACDHGSGGAGTEPGSPRVTHLSWGRLEVEGHDGAYKDAKLWPGGSRAWDWGETGTEHVPGIQPADVEELVRHGARRIILSRGMQRRLRVQDATLDWLEARGIQAEVLPTREAVERYNELAGREAVGAVLHSTC